MNPLEVYVLCRVRSAELANRFLAEFAPERSPVASEFPFPEFVDEPSIVFDNPSDLIRQLEKDGSESYSIYWNVNRGISEQVMLFFTTDGGMIIGLGGPHVSADKAFSAMRKTVDGEYGFMTSGSCPPNTCDDFVSLCEKSTLTSLFDGRVRVMHFK